jgi:hypothetical protein
MSNKFVFVWMLLLWIGLILTVLFKVATPWNFVVAVLLINVVVITALWLHLIARS